jgi:hypothetical protein
MATLNLKHLANQDVLQRIDPVFLKAFLKPGQEHLVRLGFVFPDTKTPLDYDKLASILNNPDEDMPAFFAEALEYIHEMAVESGMDALLEAAEVHRLDLKLTADPDRDPSPADVAVRFWMADKELFKEIHDQYHVKRPKSFVYFSCKDEKPKTFSVPDDSVKVSMQESLNSWLIAKKRGLGCKITSYDRPNVCAFLIRRGRPMRREAVLDKGQPTSVVYRPQKNDVVVYHKNSGILGIHTDGKRLAKKYCELFGLYLFGSEQFFPANARYTLAPIIAKGRKCLQCKATESVSSIRLTEVELEWEGENWHKTIHRADDIFHLIESNAISLNDESLLKKASFEFKLHDSDILRKMTVQPSNKVVYSRNEDSTVMEAWLMDHGFRNMEGVVDEEESLDCS